MTAKIFWETNAHTDPKFTKKFNRGGFKGVATNPTYLVKKATEAFGLMGIGWGIKIVEDELITGGPLGKTDVLCVIHKLKIELWYKIKLEEEEKEGKIYGYGLTTFVGINKNGVYTDEEAPKKSLTDAMTKCLSMLGFAGDVHMGLYDDCKYVNDMNDKFGHSDPPANKPESQQPEKQNKDDDIPFGNEQPIDDGPMQKETKSKMWAIAFKIWPKDKKQTMLELASLSDSLGFTKYLKQLSEFQAEDLIKHLDIIKKERGLDDDDSNGY